MSAITIGNDLVHYEVLGRGKPVVFVHSWLGSWRYWIPTISQLGPKYRTYAVDLWGFGDSGKNRDHYHLEGQVALIRAFVEKMGIPKAVFIGHGLGAAVLTHYALDPKYSDKVHRLMVIAPPLFDTAPGATPQQAPALPSVMDTLIRPDTAGIDREQLRQAALAAGLEGIAKKIEDRNEKSAARKEESKSVDESATKATPPPPPPPPPPVSSPPPQKGDVLFPNPIESMMGDMNPLNLLGQHIDASSPDYEKLKSEVAKTTTEAIQMSTTSFRYISTYHELLKVKSQTVALFGENDTFVSLPKKEILDRLSVGSKKVIVMPNIKHFPMLEDTTKFVRLLRDFLEAPDVSKLEMKDEWRRRNR